MEAQSSIKLQPAAGGCKIEGGPKTVNCSPLDDLQFQHPRPQSSAFNKFMAAERAAEAHEAAKPSPISAIEWAGLFAVGLPYGFAVGLGLWALYRLVRFAVKG